MTPEQLRVRAFKSIETARIIVESDPDHAAYTVGYALEFVLKARFCSKVGLASFPDDKVEARRLQVAHALTHNLDTLLKLTEHEGIAQTANVDWSVASDWGVERRYTPVGHRSADQASAQIEATAKVCEELCRYEVIDRLQKVEIEASDERGPFNFFAFCRSNSFPWWELVVAFWALDEGERAERETYIDELLNKHLDLQLQEFIGALRFVHPTDEDVQPFYLVGSVFGPIQHALQTSFRNNTVVGMRPMPQAWVVTCANWSEESVLDRIRTRRGVTAKLSE